MQLPGALWQTLSVDMAEHQGLPRANALDIPFLSRCTVCTAVRAWAGGPSAAEAANADGLGGAPKPGVTGSATCAGGAPKAEKPLRANSCCRDAPAGGGGAAIPGGDGLGGAPKPGVTGAAIPGGTTIADGPCMPGGPCCAAAESLICRSDGGCWFIRTPPARLQGSHSLMVRPPGGAHAPVRDLLMPHILP